MKIYLISTDAWTWDCYSDHVIAANSEKEVRELAQDSAADEGSSIWLTAPVILLGDYKGLNQTPFIILSSFHAG